MPPHGILQHQQIGLVQPLDLVADDPGYGAAVRSVVLLGLDVEARGIAARRIMRGALAGVEAHGVEVAQRDAPPLRRQ